MVYGKRSYGHRRKSGYRRVINMKEGKINSFSSSQLIYPEDGASITAVVAESTGGGEDQGDAKTRYQTMLNPADSSTSNPHPINIQFGSRSRVNYTVTTPGSTWPPSDGSYQVSDNEFPDGSYQVCLCPATSTGINTFEQFTGRKFATKGIYFKGAFFNAPGGGNNFHSGNLWTGETLIKVHLAVVKENGSSDAGAGSVTAPFLTGTTAHKTLTGTSLRLQHGQQPSLEQCDFGVVAFKDLDAGNNVRILKTWNFELAASGGDDAFLPFELYHRFKTPLVTTMDKNMASCLKGECSEISKNALWLLFEARGCVHMQYVGRQYFVDV